MLNIWIFTILAVAGCGSSDSGSDVSSVALSKENLTGHWKLVKIKTSDKEYAIKGTAIIQYKSDGSFVSGGQQYYREGNEALKCWSAGSGKYEIKDSILTETVEKELGAIGCTDGNFNPQPYTSTLTVSSLVNKSANGTEYFFEKDTLHADFNYTTFAEKFEKVSLAIDDPDKPSSFDMTYRTSKQGGWKYVCPRFAGQTTSGFKIAATFLYKSSVYEMKTQWDDGAITPTNYNAAPPGFSLEKRNASSSDYLSTPGTGRYSCSSISDCSSKCNLKVDKYDLSNSTSNLEITCTNLSATSTNDSDNLFGAALTNFSLKALCNYKPDLGL